MSIPADFRRVLEANDPAWDPESKDHANPELVMVFGDARNPFLECYTVEEMERIEARIDRMKSGERKKYMIKVYSSGATTTTVDHTGRIVIPAKLRARYGIGAEAYAVANLNKFQIWASERYVPTDSLEEDDMPEDLPEDLMEWLDEAEEE
ncbi:division/cell wall cluster transcriptional repressor MraZ [Mameliella sediminis]|uniref:division/cell wall cluster transcriptional repressor MraZ n=1 Tax=Mameliella sediminis TaxID=2836866 RepID=UPI001FE3BAC7|nr:cell division/cell wall cluster transcriptional repressor MraZ [Mameliella sediminis]